MTDLGTAALWGAVIMIVVRDWRRTSRRLNRLPKPTDKESPMPPSAKDYQFPKECVSSEDRATWAMAKAEELFASVPTLGGTTPRLEKIRMAEFWATIAGAYQTQAMREQVVFDAEDDDDDETARPERAYNVYYGMGGSVESKSAY